MKIIYNGETYELRPDELTGLEAEAIEDAGGTQWQTFGEWVDRFYRGGWRPLKVALWVLLRRTKPELGFEELANLKVSDVELDLSEDAEAIEGKGESAEADTEPADSPTDSDLPKPDTEASPSN